MAKARKSSVVRVKKETDLYPAIKAFLAASGYEVKGEVLDCDVTAVAEDGTVAVVELKRMLNIRLLLQAADRLDMVDLVFLGIPDTDAVYKKNRRSVNKLLKRLGMGLLLVNSKNDNVYLSILPSEYQPRKQTKKRARLLKEFSELDGDPNLGGSSTKRKRVTVYRQKALKIAAYLAAAGDSKASEVRDAVAIENARDIMYQNYYRWFDAHGKGVYSLNARGKKEYAEWSVLLK